MHVRAGLLPTQDLQKLGLAEANPCRDMLQHTLLTAVQAAVSQCGSDQDFDEHLQEVATSMALDTELLKHLIKRKIISLALFEQTDGHFLLARIETHLAHHGFRQGYFIPAD